MVRGIDAYAWIWKGCCWRGLGRGDEGWGIILMVKNGAQGANVDVDVDGYGHGDGYRVGGRVGDCRAEDVGCAGEREYEGWKSKDESKRGERFGNAFAERGVESCLLS